MCTIWNTPRLSCPPTTVAVVLPEPPFQSIPVAIDSGIIPRLAIASRESVLVQRIPVAHILRFAAWHTLSMNPDLARLLGHE